MMRLTDLKPTLLKLDEENKLVETHDYAEAVALTFNCPKCCGDEETLHGCTICRDARMPEWIKGPRWTWEGDGIHNLTTNPSIRVKLTTPDFNCEAHFYIRNGEIVMA